MPNCICILIARDINVVIVNIFVENFIENPVLSFIVSFVITFGCISLFFTPMGTWAMRVQTRLRKPTVLEHSRIDLIFFDVYKRTKLKSPRLPQDIPWFLLYDGDLNSFAVRLHTDIIHILPDAPASRDRIRPRKTPL